MRDTDIPLRFVVEHGKRVWLRVYWSGPCGTKGLGSIHNAMRFLFDHDGVVEAADRQPGGYAEEYPDEYWPQACADCGDPVPPMPQKVACECGCGQMRLPEGAPLRQVFRKTLYATPNRLWIGMPEVGDCYYADWYSCSQNGRCVHGWTNCDGHHLVIHVPDPVRSSAGDEHGSWWDTTGRASNCNRKDDTLHRCWIIHGRPEAGELVTIDKNGLTCEAGAGSIDTGRWHGSVINGRIQKS